MKQEQANSVINTLQLVLFQSTQSCTLVKELRRSYAQGDSAVKTAVREDSDPSERFYHTLWPHQSHWVYLSLLGDSVRICVHSDQHRENELWSRPSQFEPSREEGVSWLRDPQCEGRVHWMMEMENFEETWNIFQCIFKGLWHGQKWLH